MRKVIKLKAQQVLWGYVPATVGQQIQSPDLPAWEDNVAEWIEEMKQEWQHDADIIKSLGGERVEKNDPGLTGVRKYCANTREIVAAP